MGSLLSMEQTLQSSADQKTHRVPPLKLCVVGDQNSGKSSIVARYVKNQFSSIYIPTKKAALENVVKKLNVPGHATVPILLLDIPGQEDLEIYQSYFRNVDAVIVVADVSDKSQIENVIKWREIVVSHVNAEKKADSDNDESVQCSDINEDKVLRKEENNPEDLPFLFLANKADLIKGLEIATEENVHQDLSIRSEFRENVQLVDNMKEHGFAGSVLVSAKENDLSVFSAIQNFIRHILEKKYVERRLKPLEKKVKEKRPRYRFVAKMNKIGIEEIDQKFAVADEIIHRVESLKLYQSSTLSTFANHCREIGIISELRDGSMQHCLVALRDKLASLDLKLKLTLVDDFCSLEVLSSVKDAELENSIRYAVKSFNKEYAAVTKAILLEYPLAEKKLEKLDEAVDTLCRNYNQSLEAQLNESTNTKLASQAIQANRALMRHTVNSCRETLAHINASVKKVKAAFVW